MSKMKHEGLGDIIKEAIDKSGLKQSVIAERMGLRRQTINQIDRKKTFDMEFLQNLKNATGLDFTTYKWSEKVSSPVEYRPLVNLSKFEEEEISITRKVEMSLNIKLVAEEDELHKIGELMKIIKQEASKMGFQLG